MSGLLAGKVIIVTGSGGGIGTDACAVIAEAGARLVISDMTEEAAAGALELVLSKGGEARVVAADMGSEESVEALVAQTVSIYGRLDGAFNNAGVEQQNLPLTELTLAQWERCIRIDLTGVFLCVKHQIRAMLKTGGGAIVNTASGLGQVAIPNAAEYVAAKHGVVGLTRAAAVEFGGRQIRVNAILPGVIATPMIARLSTDPALETFFNAIKARQTMNRLGKPSEIGEAAKWLLSDAASFVNGAAFAVDGGFLAN